MERIDEYWIKYEGGFRFFYFFNIYILFFYFIFKVMIQRKEWEHCI